MQCRCCSSWVQIQIFLSVHVYFTFPLPSSTTLLLTSSPFNLFRPSDQQLSSFISFVSVGRSHYQLPSPLLACQSPPSTLFPFCNFCCSLHTALPFLLSDQSQLSYLRSDLLKIFAYIVKFLNVNLYIQHSNLTTAGELRVEEACC